MFGALASAGRQRVCRRSDAFWRERVQHERRNGRNGLLQGCLDGRPKPRGYHCAPVLCHQLLARRIDATIEFARLATIATRSFGQSARHTRASRIPVVNGAHQSFAWSTY